MVGIALAMFAAQFMLNGFLIYGATYFQHVLGYGPLLAAVALVPAFLLNPPFALLRRPSSPIAFGPRSLAVAGYLAAAVAFVWIAAFADDDSYWLLLPALILLRLHDRADVHRAADRAQQRGRGLAAGRRQRARPHRALDRRRRGDDGPRRRRPRRTGGRPGAAAYGAAFAVAAGVALAGALACLPCSSPGDPAHDR